jgi:hypothetical protein
MTIISKLKKRARNHNDPNRQQKRNVTQLRMKRLLKKRFWMKALATLLIIFLLYLGLLCFPQPFFHYSVSAAHLTLYSDQPFSEEEAKKVLQMTEAKLAASPLFLPQEHHAIFICNARWRQRLFFNRNYGVGGVNYYPLTRNVFLRDAVIEENRLLSPSGKIVEGDRTLDYFMVHEIGHTLTKRASGSLRHWQLPEWITEGYPDYLGKGRSFHYEEARQAFLSDAPEMDRWKSGLYLRYHLLVAHLLDKQHWSVERLLQEPIEQRVVEDAIKSEQ